MANAGSQGGVIAQPNGTYTYGELEQLWIQAGGNPAAAPIAAAIAEAESGGNPNAAPVNTNGSTDRGLWQINSVHGSQSTFDPLGNAMAAVQISQNGATWAPWCTAWSDGACGTSGGSPPGSGGVATGSPAYRVLAAGGGAGAASGIQSASYQTGTGPQGCALKLPLVGCVISHEQLHVMLGLVAMLAGGTVMFFGTAVLLVGIGLDTKAGKVAVSAFGGPSRVLPGSSGPTGAGFGKPNPTVSGPKAKVATP